MKILVIDFLEEPGHVPYNQMLLKSLGAEHEVCFASSPDYIRQVGHPESQATSVVFPRWRDRLTFRLRQCLRYCKLRRSHFLNEYDAIVFSSYETISFALTAWLFWRFKVLLIAHNNLDQLETSLVKRWFFRMIPDRVCHIGLADYIERHLAEDLRVRAGCIPHGYPGPRSAEAAIHGGGAADQRIRIFAPGRSVPPQALESLALKLVPPERFLLMARTSSARLPEGLACVMKDGFENYQELLVSSDYVFIGGAFNYRVSGVFFEAMANGRPVILQSCRFGAEMKRCFPSDVTLMTEFEGSLAQKATPNRGANPELAGRHGRPAILAAFEKAVAGGNGSSREKERTHES
jgi:hypothetical protein